MQQIQRADPASCATSAPRRNWLSAALIGGAIVLVASTTLAVGQATGSQSSPEAARVGLSLGKVFTFLFLTLGPFNVVGPFVQMTRGRDAAFRRRLALQGIVIAALALLVAATLGANTLTSWGVSAAALFITTGILLFLAGMQLVLAQYKPHRPEPEVSSVDTSSASSEAALAFSPLAFPTIVTPYGIAVLVLAITLASDGTPGVFQILAVVALVLAANLLAMLAAERVLNAPYAIAAFGILACVMAVLQIALSVQAVVTGLRLLGVVDTGAA